MKKRTGSANWTGPGKTGKGTVSTQSGVLNGNQYNFTSRFEEGTGTNPEELIAAAHAGCYSMKLSFVLGAAGFEPDSIETSCDIDFDNGVLKSSHLSVKAKVPRISPEKFQEAANEAKETCPISKALSIAITIDAQLA